MLHFDEEKMKRILIEELRYGEKTAEFLVSRIRLLDGRVQPILDQWMEDRTISDHAIHGVTMEMIFKHYHVNSDFVRALCILSTYAEDPEKAESFLKDPDYYMRRIY